MARLNITRSYPQQPASYILVHKPTDMFYIGSTRNLAKRIRDHRHYLETNTHHCRKLLEVFTSWDDIEVRFNPFDDVEDARDEEQLLLDNHANRGLCCNVATNARNLWSDKGMPADVRAKISRGLTGKKFSAERIERMRETSRGRTNSPECRAKISAALTGRSRPPEVIERIRLSNLGMGLGRKLSEQHKNNAKQARIDSGTWAQPHTEESKRKIAEANHKAVIVEGVEYESLSACASVHGVTITTVTNRINSKSQRFADWFWKN